MRLLFILSALALASSSFACSAVSDLSPLGKKDGRCELRPKKAQCTDWRDFSGPTMATMQATCESLVSAQGGGGGWTEGQRCEVAEMWGGCQSKSADGTLQTNWFYKGDEYKTLDEAKAECSGGAVWVEPS